MMPRLSSRDTILLTACGAAVVVVVGIVTVRTFTRTPPAPPPGGPPAVSTAPEESGSLATTLPSTRPSGPSWSPDDPFPEAVRIGRPLTPDEARRTVQSRVTLNVDRAPARAVFAELTRQTGVRFRPYYRIEVDWPNVPAITVAMNDAPFWDALETVLSAANMHATLAEQEVGLMDLGLNRAPRLAGSTVTGPFLVVRGSLNSGSTGTEGVPPSDMYLEVNIHPEPRLSLVGGIIDNRPAVAVDENGRSLLGPQYRPRVNVLTPSQGALKARVLLARPTGAGQTLARVAGTVPIYLEVATASAEAPPLVPKMDHVMDVGGVRFRVTGFTSYPLSDPFPPGQFGYEVTGTISRNGRPPEEWERFAHFFHAFRMRVIDASGRMINKGTGNIDRGPDSIGFAVPCSPLYTDESVGEPRALAIEVPTAVTRVEVPYEFRGLRLPERDANPNEE